MADLRAVERSLLVVDSLGCGVAAAAVTTPAARVVAPSRRGRFVLASALVATGAVLATGLRTARPGAGHLWSAAAVNACWVTGCVVSLRTRPAGPARRLVAATAVLDAAAGVAQAVLAVLAVRRGAR